MANDWCDFESLVNIYIHGDHCRQRERLVVASLSTIVYAVLMLKGICMLMDSS
jgi:hypothetical protein